MPTSTSIVCVVIPVYKSNLAASEQVALDRCVSILGKHPICIVKPEFLDLEHLSNRYPQLTFQNFHADCFAGIEGYNHMMLTDDFYARFKQYQFILVYQLDAFVFRDELLAWCAQGYDYVGAPWLPDARTPHRLQRFYSAIRRKLYRMIDRQRNGATNYTQLGYSAGNGGFSLRRVQAMRNTLAQFGGKAQLYRTGKRKPSAEDVFFCVEVNRYYNRLTIPSVVKAARFAWESNPHAASYLTDKELPFGCHGWNRRSHFDEWNPIFKNMGYSLDSLLD